MPFAGRPRSHKADGQTSTAHRPVNSTPAPALAAEVMGLRVTASPATGPELAAVLTQRRKEQWLAENRAALASSNAYVEQHGLPLVKHRAF
jgi:antitoxin CcdA